MANRLVSDQAWSAGRLRSETPGQTPTWSTVLHVGRPQIETWRARLPGSGDSASLLSLTRKPVVPVELSWTDRHIDRPRIEAWRVRRPPLALRDLVLAGDLGLALPATVARGVDRLHLVEVDMADPVEAAPGRDDGVGIDMFADFMRYTSERHMFLL